MKGNRQTKRMRSLLVVPLLLAAGFVIFVSSVFVLYRPDRPVPHIAPGSSTKPTFVVQIIRPRMGLPAAGLLPPQFVGLESHLGFDSDSAGAVINSAAPGRIEFSADDWKLLLIYDENGKISSETQVVFDLIFEDQSRRVLCRPGAPAVGTLNTVTLADTGELAGSFDIELASCDDAETGVPLGWPPEPLILHGSFDRIALDK